MKRALRTLSRPFLEIFNFQNDASKGRVIALTSTLLTTVYNVFITGIFYTGFLTMYGMSITDTGILTFTPFIANILSIFSPIILSRFQKRKRILLLSRVVYFLLYIIITNVMPLVVQDRGMRMTLFAGILFVATAFYALFSGGFTIWLYNFYPEDTDLRARYISISQICAAILSSIVLIGSGFITDALQNSPYQSQLILIFRYFAFVLVLVEIYILSRAKEYPYQDAAHLRLTEVFTQPFRYKKFRRCLLIIFVWNYIANLNNGLWNYHLLNHLDFSYATINTVSALYAACILLFSPIWNKILHRYSWFKTMGFSSILLTVPEFVFWFMTKENAYIYVPICIFQHIVAIGANLAFGNFFYLNLPKENSTAHLAFHTVGCNLFAFLGLFTGTMVSNITGDNTFSIMGMEVYSVQITLLMRGVFLLIYGAVCIICWRNFTNDEEIVRVEHMQQLMSKKQRIPLRVYAMHILYRIRNPRKKG